jgi:hypothetical protein
MRRPSISKSPEVILSSPATIRMVEDFPQPDGPSRQRNSPSLQVSDRSRTASTSPYFFQIWRSSTVAIAAYLTAPKVRPRTRWRCSRSVRTKIGMTPTAAVAMNTPQRMPIEVENPVIATGSVRT